MHLFFLSLLAPILAMAGPLKCDPARTNICGDPKICFSQYRYPDSRGDPTDCLSPTVCAVLKDMVKEYGPIQVLAADRTRRCTTSGGAGCNSMHAKHEQGQCLAADVYIEGTADKGKQAQVQAFLAGQKCRGIRYNIYCTGTVHVDKSEKADGYETCLTPIGAGCNVTAYTSEAVQRFKRAYPDYAN